MLFAGNGCHILRLTPLIHITNTGICHRYHCRHHWRHCRQCLHRHFEYVTITSVIALVVWFVCSPRLVSIVAISSSRLVAVVTAATPTIGLVDTSFFIATVTPVVNILLASHEHARHGLRLIWHGHRRSITCRFTRPGVNIVLHATPLRSLKFLPLVCLYFRVIIYESWFHCRLTPSHANTTLLRSSITILFIPSRAWFEPRWLLPV